MSTIDDSSTAGESTEVPPAVTEAIADNPEAVASLLEQSGQLSSMVDALSLLEDGLDDRMVESVAEDATTLGLAATELADDGTVELSGAVSEHGHDLVAAVERIAVMQQTGTLDRLTEIADSLADLIELAGVASDLSAELAPEFRTVVAGNRRELAELRMAFEREETLTLVKRLGDNTDTFLDLLATLDVASEAIAEVSPSDDAAVAATQADTRRLAEAFDRDQTVDALVGLGENMDTLVGLTALLEGFGDAAGRTQAEYYELGAQLGNALDTAERASDPAVLSVVEAGADAVAADSGRTVCALGLLSALRDDDVKRSLGTLVDVAERVGRERRTATVE